MTRECDTRWRLLRLLADGRFHSGSALAGQLGVSRAAVWKQKQALEDLGLRVQAVRGRGYRVSPPIELFDRSRLGRFAGELAGAERALGVEVVMTTDSSNAQLWREVDSGQVVDGHFLLAEMQQAGRGRRGRTWQSPPARNLYLSHYRRLDCDPMRLNGLSLAVGAGLADALRARLTAHGTDAVSGAIAAAKELGVKWPNDLVVQGRKLGGLLIELRGQAGGPVDVIVGVGINVEMDAAAAAAIDQPWIDLASLVGGGSAMNMPVSRNAIAEWVMTALWEIVERFMAGGFEAFAVQWARLDVLRGKAVTVHQGNGDVSGVALGVTDSGSLRVQVGDGERVFSSGEVSVRVRP
ncbi:MAG: biotin--[acetyl-CoA-carboxylase] ligase [Gammaproteobacteria bacterium]